MSSRILIVEDDRTLAKNLATSLSRHGHEVENAFRGDQALQLMSSFLPDLILLDMGLPDMHGLTLLAQLRERQAQVAVIVITGSGSERLAVDAMKAGAEDYLSKPVVLRELSLLVDKTLQSRSQARALDYYHTRQAEVSGLGKILGQSAPVQALREEIRVLVAQEAGLQDEPPATVLITGESGTGKELVARAFHFEGPRRVHPFVELNCATLPDNLIEAELFGHEKGAFTGATARRTGLVDAANGGTLFLDEIGEMAFPLQAKLLTLLESRRVRPVGSTRDHTVDVRIIAATNQDLPARVTEGKFREDLFYRLRVINLTLPPLRDRNGDIALLAEAFITQLGQRYRRTCSLSAEALSKLEHYPWPGNVRELRNTLEQAVLRSQSPEIQADDLILAKLPHAQSPAAEAVPTSLNLIEHETRLIRLALERSGGNVTRAAEMLGLSRDTLRYRLNKYQLGEHSD